MIQPEYDLLKKIQTKSRITDDELSAEDELFLQNCRSEHWVLYNDNRFFWEVSSRGEAAMKRFEYEQQQQTEREAYAKRKDRRDFWLQLLAVLFGALGVILSVVFALDNQLH